MQECLWISIVWVSISSSVKNRSSHSSQLYIGSSSLTGSPFSSPTSSLVTSLCCEMFKAFSSRSPRRISAACWALCDFPMWIFNPDSDLKWLSHWSHWKAALCLGFSLTVSHFSCCWAGWCFLFRNSSLRFAFLRRVDGLAFFLVAKVSLHLVSRVKEKVDPMLSENWKALPWLDSAWQKARHLVAREESVSSTLAILVYFWIKPKMELEERKGMSFCYCTRKDNCCISVFWLQLYFCISVFAIQHNTTQVSTIHYNICIETRISIYELIYMYIYIIMVYIAFSCFCQILATFSNVGGEGGGGVR